MSWLFSKFGLYALVAGLSIALLWSLDRAAFQRGVNHCETATRNAADAERETKRLAGRVVEQDAVITERAVARTFTSIEQEARDVFIPAPSAARVPDAAAAPVPTPAAADRACLDPAAVGVWNRAHAAFDACLAAGGADCAVRAAAAADAGHRERGAAEPRADDGALHAVRDAASIAYPLAAEPAEHARPLTITGVSDDELAEALHSAR